MKNKKILQMFLIICFFLFFVTGCWGKKNVSDEIVSSENESDVQEDPSEETEITILENEGEIEIEIPEDMESDGF